MQYIIGIICFVGGVTAMIFVGSLDLGFGLTVTFAVPLVVLAVYGLAKMPTESQQSKKVC